MLRRMLLVSGALALFGVIVGGGLVHGNGRSHPSLLWTNWKGWKRPFPPPQRTNSHA